MNHCRLKRGQLISPARTVTVIIGSVFRDLYRMPRPNLVYITKTAAAFFEESDMVKDVLRGWAEDATEIKWHPSIDYPISYF